MARILVVDGGFAMVPSIGIGGTLALAGVVMMVGWLFEVITRPRCGALKR